MIVDADSICYINFQSEIADLIRKADIIIWDEAVMAHKHIYIGVERTYRYITKNDEPFGNKILL